EVGAQVRLATEELASYLRVQSVGLDHEVEATWRGPFEGDIDTVAVVVQLTHSIVVTQLGVCVCCVSERRGELAAGEFHRIAVGLGGKPSQTFAGTVHQGQRTGIRRCGTQRRKYVHPLDDGECGAAHVDGAAAGPLSGGCFDHGGLDTVTSQPVGQCRPCYTGPDDEDTPNVHGVIVAGPGRPCPVHDAGRYCVVPLPYGRVMISRWCSSGSSE